MHSAPDPIPPRLLEEVARACRARHFSPRTVEAYVGWIRRFVLFHGRHHPRNLTGDDVARFLSALANDRKVSSSTQNQAASALLFMYREVLRVEVTLPAGVARPSRPRR